MKTFIKRTLPIPIVNVIKSAYLLKRQCRRLFLNGSRDVLFAVKTPICRFNIYINPYRNGCVDEQIYLNGVWEPRITELIYQYLPENGYFFDVGANIGYHSLAAAGIVKGSGRVYAFEPIPVLQNQIKSSAERNNFTNVIVAPFALGDCNKVDEISLVSENIGASSLFGVDTERFIPTGVKIKVEVVTLDSFVKENNIKQLDLLKIDAEGSEYEVLQGARKSIDEFRPVIILEFSPRMYSLDYEKKADEFYEFLQSLNYTIVDARDSTRKTENWKSYLVENNLQTDFLCIPKRIN